MLHYYYYLSTKRNVQIFFYLYACGIKNKLKFYIYSLFLLAIIEPLSIFSFSIFKLEKYKQQNLNGRILQNSVGRYYKT